MSTPTNDPYDPNTAPPPPASGPGPAPVAPGYPVGGSPRNGLGTAALVLGILAVLFGVLFFPLGFLLALAGIGVGIAGRRRATRGEATNGGAALTGLILSVVGLLIAIAAGFFVGYIFSQTEECQDQNLTRAEREQCIENELSN